MKPKSEAANLGTPKKEDLELAHKIYALARLIRGQLAAPSWAAAAPPSIQPAALPGPFPGVWTIPPAWAG